MPDLLAGTTVLAQDTPSLVEAEAAENEDNISSTTPIPGTAGQCTLTFIAPTTGRVQFLIYLAGRGGSSNEELRLGVEVRQNDVNGAVVASAANPDDAVGTSTPTTQRISAHRTVSSLTPGATYFARTMHWVSGGSTADIFHRRLTVTPAT